jgi:hypothetical protein
MSIVGFVILVLLVLYLDLRQARGVTRTKSCRARPPAGRGYQCSRLDRPVAWRSAMAHRPGLGIHETAGATTDFPCHRVRRCGER